MNRPNKTGKGSNAKQVRVKARTEKSHIMEKCIWKHCRKMVKVDHSFDIPGFAYASGLCKKHEKMV